MEAYGVVQQVDVQRLLHQLHRVSRRGPEGRNRGWREDGGHGQGREMGPTGPAPGPLPPRLALPPGPHSPPHEAVPGGGGELRALLVAKPTRAVPVTTGGERSRPRRAKNHLLKPSRWAPNRGAQLQAAPLRQTRRHLAVRLPASPARGITGREARGVTGRGGGWRGGE